MQFSGGTGAIRVIQKKGIEKGEEILMTYGKEYWRGKKKRHNWKKQRSKGWEGSWHTASMAVEK